MDCAGGNQRHGIPLWIFFAWISKKKERSICVLQIERSDTLGLFAAAAKVVG